MRRYFVGEYKSLKYSDKETPSEGNIFAEDADQLVDAVKNYTVIKPDDIFKHGRNELGTYGAVGVVATEDCQIEILPKIDDPKEIEFDHYSARNQLVQMLEVVHSLQIEIARKTYLDSQSDSILEIFITKFCNQLEEAFKRELPMLYIEEEEDLPALRGKLNIIRQFGMLTVRPDKLACRYDNRSADIPLNQTVLAAINLLSRITRARDNRQNLLKMKFVYEDVSEIDWSVLKEQSIHFDRTNEHWKEVYQTSRLFLDQLFQSTTLGKQNGYALLFNMSELFEGYVFTLLKSKLQRRGYRVEEQYAEKKVLYNERGNGIFGTKLDIAILKQGQTRLIIDTKWKRLKEPSRVDQADVYQMMAYGELYDCPDVVLLYPHNRDLGNPPMKEKFYVKEYKSNKRIHIATIDVTMSRQECAEQIQNLAQYYLNGDHLSINYLPNAA